MLLGIRGPIADQYADQQRAEMLSRIVDLELEIKEKEDTITSLCKEFEEKQLQYEEKIAGELFVWACLHICITLWTLDCVYYCDPNGRHTAQLILKLQLGIDYLKPSNFCNCRFSAYKI